MLRQNLVLLAHIMPSNESELGGLFFLEKNKRACLFTKVVRVNTLVFVHTIFLTSKVRLLLTISGLFGIGLSCSYILSYDNYIDAFEAMRHCLNNNWSIQTKRKMLKAITNLNIHQNLLKCWFTLSHFVMDDHVFVLPIS